MKKVSPEVRAYIRSRIVDCKERDYAVKVIGELLNVADDYVYHVLEKYRENGNILPEEKVLADFCKSKKEDGLILFGDETGICNQENYQRGFSPKGKAPIVKLPVKKEKINMISAISRQGFNNF